MTTLSASEVQAQFDRLLRRVIAGEEIVITRGHKPVARLVSERQEPKRNMKEVRKAVADLRRLRKQIAARGEKGRITLAEMRSAIAEGRR
ncbi:MAG TPA: type II toxin-antitoxin system prevent-host-death family antitoxin [Phycisphaerae bacterium]|nr:type II toxin-antitoxin system prevent-host-death family antitoxin [Phycisphaerae bacterium]